MPGRDGTGPRGFGLGTGWSAGYCRENSLMGYANFIPEYRNRMGFGYTKPLPYSRLF
ncbi:MAG: DUF5320 domain-containing protein [Bacillota bacterium]|nr:DUF5320 domain-containing protein [Bacillota bacterium]